MKLFSSYLKKDDNLFSEATMSFGDHLEELRTRLWYCVLWLFLGFGIGLYFGGGVVAYIQTPLSDALRKFYLEQSTLYLQRESTLLKSQGYPDWVASIPMETKLIPEEFYVYPGQIESLIETRTLLLDPKAPNAFDEVDNLNPLKDSKPQAGGVPQIEYTQKPKLLLLFRKIENDNRLRSQALNMHETFTMYIKASLLLGFVIASPAIIYNIWAFIAVGLYAHERKYVYMFMPLSIFLFIAGAYVAFYYVFQFVLDFLLMFNGWLKIDPAPRINEWISFAIMLPVGFGISFQMPLVMFVLERIGIFSVEQYMSKWKISILIIFVISMFLTPADPWSMLLMAVPLTFLYFAGVWLCKLVPKRKFDE